MENIASIEINRPINEVFELTTRNVAEWSIVVVSDEVVKEKPEGVGTTFLTVTEDHGKQMTLQGVVTKEERPFVHAVHMTCDMFDIDSEFTFEDLSGRTRVTQRASVSFKGFLRVFMFLFGWMMKKGQCKASQAELESLKRYCEAGAGAAD